MRETFQRELPKLVRRAKKLSTHPSAELVRAGKEMAAKLCTTWQQKADDEVSLMPSRRKKCRIPFAALALVLAFIYICMSSSAVWAIGYHSTHTMTATVAHQAHAASTTANHGQVARPLGVPWWCYLPFAGFDSQCGGGACGLGWLVQVLDSNCQGNDNDNNPWDFPCTDDSNSNPDVSGDAGDIKNDWLSGDFNASASTSTDAPGHFLGTYASETYQNQTVENLFSVMEGLGLGLLTPMIVLIGYQLLWASWTYRYAGILEILPRLILSIVLVVGSYQLIGVLVAFENTANMAIMALHGESQFAFPTTTINGNSVTYTLTGDESSSLRAIVMPMGRWGCMVNIFLGILQNKLITDAASAVIPFVGGLVGLAGKIADALDVVKNLGNFILMILSVGIFAQVLFRIILLNYYIMLAPVAFACWSLPGGVGQAVVKEWLKGFFSVLFVQTVQIFVAVTLPLLIPPLPSIPWDGTGILQNIILQLPLIIVAAMVSKVPKIVGTKATASIAQAGAVAGGAVTAVAAAAYQTV